MKTEYESQNVPFLMDVLHKDIQYKNFKKIFKMWVNYTLDF